MKKIITILLVIAGFMLFFQTEQADATLLNITGGVTKVQTLDASFDILDGAFLDAVPLGLAEGTPNTFSFPELSFPMTGGTFDATGRSLIEHDGSGIQIVSRLESDFLRLENFLIDTDPSNPQLFGDARGNDSGVLGNIPIFDIVSDLGDSRLFLEFTSDAANGLTGEFGVPDLTGFRLGFVSGLQVEGNPVPEPATLLLLSSGLVGLAGFGRKRFKK